MEDMIKTHEFMTMAANTNSNPYRRLALHKDSKAISKPKQKIRIIHVFAPEIIETDVESFRELVQRLTGKPSNENSCWSKEPKALMTTKDRDMPQEPSSSHHVSLCNKTNLNMKLELRNEFRGLDPRDRVKLEEERIWDAETIAGGYFGGFADLEGFISNMNGEFPLFT